MLKKKILIFLLLHYSLITFSQSLSKLDSNNGYKHLKFGMSKSQIKNIKLNTEYTKPHENVKYYNYQGNDLKYIEGILIQNIIIAFYKDKLYGIQLVFSDIHKEFTDSESTILIDALKSSFGYNYYDCNRMGEKLNCLIWDGKKVRCEFIRINETETDGTRNPNYNYVNGYILFQYKPYVDERKRSNF